MDSSKIFTKTPKILLLLPLYLCFFTACSKNKDNADEVSTSKLQEIELDHQFTISNPEEVILQQVNGIESDSKGRIYMADERALQIHVFDPEGNYLTSIGRDGSGPGEFQSLMNIYIDETDRLFAFDIRQARTTIFTEKAPNSWEAEELYMIEGERYSIESADSAGNVVLRQSLPQTPEPGVFWYEHELVSGNLSSGLRNQDIRRFKSEGNLVSDNRMMARIPFGRTTLLAAGHHGDIYLVWNEEFSLARYNAEMELVDSLSVPIPNQPVNEQERGRAINTLGEPLRSLGQQHIPETKPVVSDMFIDENNNLWLQTYDSPEYLVLSGEGAPLGSFDLPNDLQLAHVGTNQLYALNRGQEGYELHVFEFKLPAGR